MWAERYAEELATELPEVDAVVGFEHYSELPQQVMRVLEATQGVDEGAADEGAAQSGPYQPARARRTRQRGVARRRGCSACGQQ